MVAIIVYGLVAGVILSVFTFTRKIGLAILSLVGILFVVTAGLLLLGELFIYLLPFIIIVGGAYGIYHLAVNKGKPKKKDYEKMSPEGKIDLLKRLELAPNNEQYNKWFQNISKEDSKYQRIVSILNMDREILNTYNDSNELIGSLEHLKGEYENIINTYQIVLNFDNQQETEITSDLVLDLERLVVMQKEALQRIKNFENLIEDTYKSVIENFIEYGLKGKKLFMFGENKLQKFYDNIDSMVEDATTSLLKAHKLLSVQVKMHEKFNRTISIIDEALNEINKSTTKSKDDIEKIKEVIYLAYVNEKIKDDIEEARDTTMDRLYNIIGNMSSDDLIEFEEFEESVIGKGAYFKKINERWTIIEDEEVHSFKVQYKEYIIYVLGGFIAKIEKGYIEE